MPLFTKDTIDRVRDAVDMVQLVGQKTDLRRVGTRWTGLCPFHDERTPSFSVSRPSVCGAVSRPASPWVNTRCTIARNGPSRCCRRSCSR